MKRRWLWNELLTIAGTVLLEVGDFYKAAAAQLEHARVEVPR